MNILNNQFLPKSSPVALITGAASTLGSAISIKLAQEGMRLALHYGKSHHETNLLQKKINASGVETLLLQSDLSKPEHVKSMISQIVKKWGRVDVLVNNASFFKSTPLANENWKVWQKIFSINSVSPFALAAAAKPWLRQSRGCIVNITDIYGELPILQDHSAYSASKATLVFLTKYLAIALAPEIRVNAVSPGVISFPEKYDAQKRQKLILKSALKRSGKPEEIADSVWFLVSNRFVTGQILKVDGGRFIS